MAYKTILVYVDDSPHLVNRVNFSAKVAQSEMAHLIGVAVTGISRLLQLPTINVDPQFAANGNPYKPEYIDQLRHNAQSALTKFKEIVKPFNLPSIETKLIDDDASDAISSQGVYADLIVLGQNDNDNPSLIAKVDFPEYVALHSSCPVLIIPCAPRTETIGDSVLIAWNGSMAASRAVRNAMPFLQRAKNVRIAIFESANTDKAKQQESCEEIVAFLERHHIQVELVRRTVVDNIGQAMLELAIEKQVDLMVMGCVAHQRWRGVLLGGSTRVILENATIPVLMSH
ncbi:universal stress protein [Sapientia aquatica]|uniref:universal stress protein n=1 Tax=Sapientia aquatica TaxID=1549640 RepID=UPI001405511C|nr:universal stress protein [Sapientia aquatica]